MVLVRAGHSVATIWPATAGLVFLDFPTLLRASFLFFRVPRADFTSETSVRENCVRRRPGLMKTLSAPYAFLMRGGLEFFWSW
jgi:hypothetical protein